MTDAAVTQPHVSLVPREFLVLWQPTAEPGYRCVDTLRPDPSEYVFTYSAEGRTSGVWTRCA